jgi:hypothetical protein
MISFPETLDGWSRRMDSSCVSSHRFASNHFQWDTRLLILRSERLFGFSHRNLQGLNSVSYLEMEDPASSVICCRTNPVTNFCLSKIIASLIIRIDVDLSKFYWNRNGLLKPCDVRIWKQCSCAGPEKLRKEAENSRYPWGFAQISENPSLLLIIQWQGDIEDSFAIIVTALATTN